MVETTTNTEGCLLTTTGNRYIVVLAQTGLGDCITPVGIVTVLAPLRESTSLVQIVDFRNTVLVRSVIILTRVEVFLLQHHRIVITTQQVVAGRLMGGSELQGIGHVGLTARTTLGGQLNDTVTTL